MEEICLVLPLLEGKTEDARAFMRELEEERKADYARSEERIGVTKEVWFLASLPSGDGLVAYMESRDFAKTVELFVQSRDDFDMWFKQRLNDVSGLDMNNPPEGMQFPEKLSSYSA